VSTRLSGAVNSDEENTKLDSGSNIANIAKLSPIQPQAQVQAQTQFNQAPAPVQPIFYQAPNPIQVQAQPQSQFYINPPQIQVQPSFQSSFQALPSFQAPNPNQVQAQFQNQVQAQNPNQVQAQNPNQVQAPNQAPNQAQSSFQSQAQNLTPVYFTQEQIRMIKQQGYPIITQPNITGQNGGNLNKRIEKINKKLEKINNKLSKYCD